MYLTAVFSTVGIPRRCHGCFLTLFIISSVLFIKICSGNVFQIGFTITPPCFSCSASVISLHTKHKHIKWGKWMEKWQTRLWAFLLLIQFKPTSLRRRQGNKMNHSLVSFGGNLLYHIIFLLSHIRRIKCGWVKFITFHKLCHQFNISHALAFKMRILFPARKIALVLGGLIYGGGWSFRGGLLCFKFMALTALKTYQHRSLNCQRRLRSCR